MTSNDVKRLAAMGEGRTLEFKNRVPRPERIAREVIALANTDGGSGLEALAAQTKAYCGEQMASMPRRPARPPRMDVSPAVEERSLFSRARAFWR